MTDIEVLRENVINAARAMHPGNRSRNLHDAIDALDAALTPDPSRLLSELIEADDLVQRAWDGDSLKFAQDDLGRLMESIKRYVAEWRAENP
jgi:hypothetical protein